MNAARFALSITLLSIVLTACSDGEWPPTPAVPPPPPPPPPAPAAPAAPAAAPARPDVDALLARAHALGAAGRHVESARVLRSAVELLPESARPAVHATIARHYERARLPDSALEHAERAIALGDTNPELLFVKGNALLALKRFDEAESALTELVGRLPDHRRGLERLAALRLDTGEADRALELMERAVAVPESAPSKPGYRASPEILEGMLVHARALRLAGRHQDALDRLVGVLEEDPFQTTALAELVQVLFRLRRRDEAVEIQSIHRALREEDLAAQLAERLGQAGNFAAALVQQGLQLERRRRLFEAYRSYRQAASIDMRDARMPFFLAEICTRVGRQGEAASVVDSALAAGSKPRSGLLWLRARLRLESDDPKGALEAARDAAAALEKEGDLGGYAKAQAPAFSLALTRAGAALEAGDLDGAASFAAAARELDDARWEPHYWLGRVELSRGQAKSAIDHFANASKRGNPQNTDLLYHNGLALDAAGHRTEAFRQFVQITRSDTDPVAAYDELIRLLGESADSIENLESARDAARARAERIESLRRDIDRLSLEETADARVELARILLRSGDPAAHDMLFFVHGLEPERPDVMRILLGGMKRPQDRFVRLHTLRRLLSVAPDDDNAAGALATLYLDLNARTLDAARLAERVHSRSTSSESHHLLARAALARGERERALDIVRRGLAAYPEHEGLLGMLSELEK